MANLPTPDPRLAHLASALLDAHRIRGRYFSPELLADPVWAMMVFTYVGEGRTADVSIDSLCESQVFGSATVTLRWLAMLLDKGVFHRAEDDARPGHTLVRLSPDAQKNLENWLRFLQDRLDDRDLADADSSI